MRSLKESILSTTKVGLFDEWNTFKKENAHPKNKKELRSIIKKAIELKGPNVDLNWINVSRITDMSSLFKCPPPDSSIESVFAKFNGDISKWDVSKVKNMSSMFMHSNFNGDISKWDVGNVKNMGSMFDGSKFNGDISKWDVSNVKTMEFMFEYSEFNGDISKWDVSNVEDMTYMFWMSKFNGDISKWDVGKVKSVYLMFGRSPLEKNPPAWYK